MTWRCTAVPRAVSEDPPTNAGEDHPDTATGLISLGYLLCSMGDLAGRGRITSGAGDQPVSAAFQAGCA